MAYRELDRVRQFATTTGTGTFTVNGTVPTGFQSWTALTDGDTAPYVIRHQTLNEWEAGIGTWTTTGTLLARTTIRASSNGGAAVNFSAGSKDVFISPIAGGPKAYREIAEPAGAQTNEMVLWAEDQDGVSMLRHKGTTGVVRTITQDQYIIARNTSGGTITKGQAVYISGASGQRPTIGLAKADAESTMPAVGVAADDISNNTQGLVMIGGHLFDLNTSSFSDGNVLYVSAATAGALTATAPTGLNLAQKLAIVTNSHAVQGKLLIQVKAFDGGPDPALLYARTVEPATPPADTLALYGKYIAGRAMLKQKGPSGLDTPLQPALFQNTVRLISPNTTTTFSLIGGAVTTVGTISHPAPTATSYGLSPQVATAATLNTGGGTSDSVTYFLRGDGTAGQASGFFYNCRFWFAAAGDIVNSGVFMGMSNGTLVQMTASAAPNQVYCGLHQHDAAAAPRDTKFAFVTRNAGTVVVQDTGQVITINKLYDFYMFSPPYAGAAPVLSMQLINQTDGVSSSHTFPNTEAQLPPATTLMRQISTTLTTEAVAKNIRIKKIYVESDL